MHRGRVIKRLFPTNLPPFSSISRFAATKFVLNFSTPFPRLHFNRNDEFSHVLIRTPPPTKEYVALEGAAAGWVEQQGERQR